MHIALNILFTIKSILVIFVPARKKEPSAQSSVDVFTAAVRLAVAIDVMLSLEKQVALVLKGLVDPRERKLIENELSKSLSPRLRHATREEPPSTLHVQVATAPTQSSPRSPPLASDTFTAPTETDSNKG